MKDNAKQLAGILKKIKNKEVFHVQIPPKNKMVFNQVVPYLFLYRQFFNPDPMLAELVKSEPAYFRVKDSEMNVSDWIAPILNQLVEEFGACLIIEAWTAGQGQEEDIQIHIARKNVQSIAQYLGKQLETEESIAKVEIVTESKTNATQSLSPASIQLDKLNSNILYMGLEIKPKYLLGTNQQILPIDLRHFREAISRSLSKTFFEFIRIHTLSKPTSFKISHPKKMLPLAWEIDQKLARESQRFDFLLLITPTNSYDAWLQFRKGNYRKVPVFRYRPMPIDPDIIKRNLYNLHIEDLYDPSIAYLFRDKRKELDQMMSMLSERGKEGFLLGSMQVFGTVNEKLLEKAQAILTITATDREHRTKEEDIVYAEEFAKLAQEELDYLKSQDPNFSTTVRLRDDIYGVMVNQGVLNISKQYSLPRHRVQALIQHEVGTHIVTYYNGKQQPFSLFRLGVPGYEKLQEGLAVLAEYLVGGLTNNRLRILAGRVVAVYHMQQGNTFLDTFALLVDKYQFLPETAFQMTMRVFRSGGLTKDALYLSGLIELINYIKSGRDLTLLTMGKIREDYIPIVEELMLKGILNAPVLTPKYLTSPYRDVLANLKKSKGIFQMIQ
ncbi:tyrosine/phenylalanine carboxypeptidase domain-containing protein [Sphingobacterium sp. DR205]|uniref:flavohemoglobin expression-modulating QEGLA motif protein n=1 Tax=Sphingobacterium sp. DR205 TaxID=2713573 RepID=UPI001F4982E4|nr:tyrosine/phenylalanine carboxypeptidase domain-containing protein [Sphingobacterium sp. DR205]